MLEHVCLSVSGANEELSEGARRVMAEARHASALSRAVGNSHSSPKPTVTLGLDARRVCIVTINEIITRMCDNTGRM